VGASYLTTVMVASLACKEIQMIKIAAALAGGGARGSFQVGVLKALAARGDVPIDAYAGVSTGAIQAMAAAAGDIAALEQHWLDIKGNNDIFTHNGFWGSGQVSLSWPKLMMPNWAIAKADATPLLSRIRKFAHGRTFVKPIKVGAVSLQSGSFMAFQAQQGDAVSKLEDHVWASCLVPVQFLPRIEADSFGNITQWVDGGVREIAPVKSALDWQPRGILLIRCHTPAGPDTETRKLPHLVAIAERVGDIMQAEISNNDYAFAGAMNDYVNMRKKIRTVIAADPNCAAGAAIATELDAYAAKHRMIPILVIRPAASVGETQVYNPEQIKGGIKAGELMVASMKDEIDAFLEQVNDNV